jgi:hypothetical protein
MAYRKIKEEEEKSDRTTTHKRNAGQYPENKD